MTMIYYLFSSMSIANFFYISWPMLQKPIKKMWIVFSMVTPPLIAAVVTGIQLYRQDTYDSVEEELGMDLKFERKLNPMVAF